MAASTDDSWCSKPQPFTPTCARQPNSVGRSPLKLLAEPSALAMMKCSPAFSCAAQPATTRGESTKLPPLGIAQPGTLALNAPAPLDDVTTPMWTFGSPPGSCCSTWMKVGKFWARFCCTVVIDDESST